MTTPGLIQLFDLTGKIALVTGGASGIGQAIVLRLAEARAAVMITDINQDAAQQVIETIRATGNTAHALEADASHADDASRVVQATVDAFGRLDILVNNAGIYPLLLAFLRWKIDASNVKEAPYEDRSLTVAHSFCSHRPFFYLVIPYPIGEGSTNGGSSRATRILTSFLVAMCLPLAMACDALSMGDCHRGHLLQYAFYRIHLPIASAEL